MHARLPDGFGAAADGDLSRPVKPSPGVGRTLVASLGYASGGDAQVEAEMRAHLEHLEGHVASAEARVVAAAQDGRANCARLMRENAQLLAELSEARHANKCVMCGNGGGGGGGGERGFKP